jgi:hypothetical protein
MTSVRDLEHPSTPLDATAPPLVALLTLGDEGWGVTPSIKINEGPPGGVSVVRRVQTFRQSAPAPRRVTTLG